MKMNHNLTKCWRVYGVSLNTVVPLLEPMLTSPRRQCLMDIGLMSTRVVVLTGIRQIHTTTQIDVGPMSSRRRQRWIDICPTSTRIQELSWIYEIQLLRSIKRNINSDWWQSISRMDDEALASSRHMTAISRLCFRTRISVFLAVITRCLYLICLARIHILYQLNGDISWIIAD